MSLLSQNLIAYSNPRISLHCPNSHVTALRNPSSYLSLPRNEFFNCPHFQILGTKSPNLDRWPVRAFESDGAVRRADGFDGINLDAVLSVIEFLCLASSAVISVGLAANSAIPSSQKAIIPWLGQRVFAWQFVLLVGGVAAGALIRGRQWRRLCKDVSRTGNSGVNLVERIEKLEEDLRSSATIIRALSRQLEKLGIRFRVTRKTLKDPIAETAALAQKNSEATRALAKQEDILERELSEIQKVLLAMQEQQRKQLELILAIGKAGKLFDNKQGPPPSRKQEAEASKTHNSAQEKSMDGRPQVQAVSVQKEVNSDRA